MSTTLAIIGAEDMGRFVMGAGVVDLKFISEMWSRHVHGKGDVE